MCIAGQRDGALPKTESLASVQLPVHSYDVVAGVPGSAVQNRRSKSVFYICVRYQYILIVALKGKTSYTYTIGNCNPRFSRRGYFFPKRHNLLSIFSPLILCSKV